MVGPASLSDLDLAAAHGGEGGLVQFGGHAGAAAFVHVQRHLGEGGFHEHDVADDANVGAQADELDRCEIAARIAERHGLEDAWFNDAAKAFIDKSRMSFEPVMELGALRVMRPDDEGMLAELRLLSGTEKKATFSKFKKNKS